MGGSAPGEKRWAADSVWKKCPVSVERDIVLVTLCKFRFNNEISFEKQASQTFFCFQIRALWIFFPETRVLMIVSLHDIST